MSKNLQRTLIALVVIAVIIAIVAMVISLKKGEMLGLNIEDYDPYVMYNGGINTSLPITTTGALSAGTLAVTGATTLSSSLSVAGATTLTGAVGAGTVVTDRLTFGATTVASSTANSAETLPVSYLSTYSGMDYTPGNLAVTLTLPATSTMTSFIPSAGDCALWRIRNLDGTAATSTTIAAGSGIDLVENENGDVVIEGGNEAQILFCRELDTDVTAYVDEYIAAD